MSKMKKEDIYYMSAYEMREKIKNQEITSEEITEIIIERIEKINPLINAYCTPTFDLAKDLAKTADQAVKKGEKLGLLHGVPISIKDETETKGIRTTYGSKLMENNIPGMTACIGGGFAIAAGMAYAIKKREEERLFAEMFGINNEEEN